MQIQQIKISEIRRDEDQPRKHFDEETLERLTVSIRDNGVEQPITVRKNGSGYILVDGERRWRASQKAGIEELPCIITDKEDILEQQLRSDCLKERLTADELDRAIYRYYEELLTSSKKNFEEWCKKRNPTGKGGHRTSLYIAEQIGKSDVRVSKAIDRFEFKRDNKEFTEKIQKKYNPENKEYSKVNSTIAMTDRLKNKPEHRKAVIEAILENRQKEKFGLDNDRIKKKIDVIVNKAESEHFTPEDVKTVLEDIRIKEEPIKMLKSDPRYLFQKQYFEFSKFVDAFYDYEFDTVKDYLSGSELLKKFVDEVDGFKNYLLSLEETND